MIFCINVHYTLLIQVITLTVPLETNSGFNTLTAYCILSYTHNIIQPVSFMLCWTGTVLLWLVIGVIYSHMKSLDADRLPMITTISHNIKTMLGLISELTVCATYINTLFILKETQGVFEYSSTVLHSTSWAVKAMCLYHKSACSTNRMQEVQQVVSGLRLKCTTYSWLVWRASLTSPLPAGLLTESQEVFTALLHTHIKNACMEFFDATGASATHFTIIISHWSFFLSFLFLCMSLSVHYRSATILFSLVQHF